LRWPITHDTAVNDPCTNAVPRFSSDGRLRPNHIDERKRRLDRTSALGSSFLSEVWIRISGES
jgi:hypothetical protein